MLDNFACFFCRLLMSFKINFSKNSFMIGTLSEYQMAWIQIRTNRIRTNILLVLIWVETVCKGYQLQLPRKELTDCNMKVNEPAHEILTLNVPSATKVVCVSLLLKCLRSLYGKQCGPRSDCSCRSSLFWVQAVCFNTLFVSNVRQLFAADDIFRCIFFLAL